MSDRCGGKAVFLVGMVCLSSCSVLLPLLARLSPHLVLLARLVQGAASGLAFPSLYNLFRNSSVHHFIVKTYFQTLKRTININNRCYQCVDGPGGARYPDVCRVRRDPHRHRPHLPPHLLAVPGAPHTNSPVGINTALVRAGRGLAHGFLRAGRDRSGLVRPLLLPGLQQTPGPPLYCIASSVPVLLSPSLSRVRVFIILPDRTTPGYPSASWST